MTFIHPQSNYQCLTFNSHFILNPSNYMNQLLKSSIIFREAILWGTAGGALGTVLQTLTPYSRFTCKTSTYPLNYLFSLKSSIIVRTKQTFFLSLFPDIRQLLGRKPKSKQNYIVEVLFGFGFWTIPSGAYDTVW